MTTTAHLRGALILGFGLMLVGCSTIDVGTPQGRPTMPTMPSVTPTPSPDAAEPAPTTPVDPAPANPVDPAPANPVDPAPASPPDDPPPADPPPAEVPPADPAQPAPEVIVSPLRIPLPTDELMGRPYPSGLEDLKTGIGFACGGTQCVSVLKVGESLVLESDQSCDTIRRVQGAGRDAETHRPFVDVPSGGTIVVVVNVRCEDVPVGDLDPVPPPADGTTSDAPPTDTDDPRVDP